MKRYAATAFLLFMTAATSRAHYNMLLPETHFTKKGDKVTFIYQWGHPFEHELFDTPAPKSLVALSPDGKQHDLTKSLEKIQVPGLDKKMVDAFRFTFSPEQRGDYTFMLTTPPIFLGEPEEWVQDVVKVVLHVSVQKGWDADPGRQFKIIPITRPYGLLPGMVFQAQVFQDQIPGKVSENAFPFKNAVVEYERYNPSPPKDLPTDELITFKTKTDNQGIATVSFPLSGWWSLTTQRDAGTHEHAGKKFPLRQRLTLWLHVDEKK
jgi:cobalt/nickel transport protein